MQWISKEINRKRQNNIHDKRTLFYSCSCFIFLDTLVSASSGIDRLMTMFWSLAFGNTVVAIVSTGFRFKFHGSP
jgi:hypothetical protein